MKKFAAAAASAALAVTAIGVGAGPASAATVACKNISYGSLCVSVVSDGYRAEYNKTGGSAIVADFNLQCKKLANPIGDYGAFPISKGQTRSYVFKVGALGACRVRLYDVTHGSFFYTGYVTK